VIESARANGQRLTDVLRTQSGKVQRTIYQSPSCRRIDRYSLASKAMKKLKSDNARFLIGITAVNACFVGLYLLKRLQLFLGLKEREFYEQYPIGWYVAIALGIGFIASLVLSVKKAYDANPNIQLRSETNEILENVLADPDYEPWHKEARRLLEKRKA